MGGYEDFRIHDLRHTCAAWLVTAGVPLSEVRDSLVHSTVVMTEKYAHLAPKNVRSAVQRIEKLSQFGHDGESGNTEKDCDGNHNLAAAWNHIFAEKYIFTTIQKLWNAAK